MTALKRRQDGFTMVEVLVAAMVLAVGALAVLTILVVGLRNVERGKSSQVAIDVAQREMEKVRILSYDQVALTGLPTHSTDPDNPRFRVSGTTFGLARDGGDAAPMVKAATGVSGALAPSESFQIGVSGSRVTGTIYRFVVRLEDAGFEGEQGAEYRRVVVAVWLDPPHNQSKRPAYYEIQSDFVDPDPG